MYMAMKRTTVRADEEDLVILKEAARRRGVPEAELLREAIHLVAMANRTWDRPFFTCTYTADDEQADTGAVLEQVWSEKAEAYERGKSTAR